MTRILVTSTLARDGKSVVAVGIASALRATGATVRLVRIDDSESAASDAQQLARVNGVRGGLEPVAASDIPADTEHTVVEASSAQGIDADRTVLVVRQGEADDDTVSRALADLKPDAVIVNGVSDLADRQPSSESPISVATLLAPSHRIVTSRRRSCARSRRRLRVNSQATRSCSTSPRETW